MDLLTCVINIITAASVPPLGLASAITFTPARTTPTLLPRVLIQVRSDADVERLAAVLQVPIERREFTEVGEGGRRLEWREAKLVVDDRFEVHVMGTHRPLEQVA